jgi:hypothetical protein
MRCKVAFIALGCALLAAAVAAPASACPRHQSAAVSSAEHSAPAPDAASAPLPAPAQGGMVVGRDPETGEIGLPSPEQRQELAAKEMGAAALAGKALFEVALPGVGFRIDLQGLLQDYAVATVGPDGKPRLSCLHEAADVQRFIAAGARPSSSAPEQTAPAPAPSQWEEK